MQRRSIHGCPCMHAYTHMHMHRQIKKLTNYVQLSSSRLQDLQPDTLDCISRKGPVTGNVIIGILVHMPQSYTL